jgi:hypothetical protein
VIKIYNNFFSAMADLNLAEAALDTDPYNSGARCTFCAARKYIVSLEKPETPYRSSIGVCSPTVH